MSDCKRTGVERCGLDVSCYACSGSADYRKDEMDLRAESALDLPYFDVDGNEGTLGEVYA